GAGSAGSGVPRQRVVPERSDPEGCGPSGGAKCRPAGAEASPPGGWAMNLPRRFTWLLAAGWVSFLGCRSAPPPRPTEPVIGAPVSQPEPAAAKPFADGIAAFEAGNLGVARELFAQALVRSPRMVNAQYNLGLIAEREGDFRRAQRAYEAALEIDP